MNFIKENVCVKLGIVVEIIFCCILVCGCFETVEEKELDKSLINAELVNALNDTAMRNAIISQHTVFPYHFLKNSDKLNELGERDLAVLAGHFKDNPGQLNVCRNNTTENLYQARVDFVLNRLQETGVAVDRISVSDGMPGGPGMPSERVLSIMESKDQPTQGKTRTSSTTIGSRGR
ncbi:hypothetical protein ES708_30210 [subsurface metagenome]